MCPFSRHFRKHFLILIAFFFVCLLFRDQIAHRLPLLQMPYNQDRNEEMVQDAYSCTVERHFEDAQYLKISCRVQQPSLGSTDYRRNLIFMVPTVPKHLRRQWNLKVPFDAVV
ncbi:uncharacterized protein LOC117587201 isoform X2 [Drosophila guanche]|uniref:Uncharacterized protein n=1 Tax=Drosophila guanche TaxID=7266 RepID=A0A3B0KMA1_DROGU|nr:uncharacterized protein LOC117587201 isoform X2 [Drosophila guanche]SPP84928.1 Hypothetical predicted protein [Drosophila guanche]